MPEADTTFFLSSTEEGAWRGRKLQHRSPEINLIGRSEGCVLLRAVSPALKHGAGAGAQQYFIIFADELS